jgi:hypothetical protein
MRTFRKLLSISLIIFSGSFASDCRGSFPVGVSYCHDLLTLAEAVQPWRGVQPYANASTVMLSDEQQAVLRRVRQGQSTFFSGSAGTGKSVLLREIISQLGGGPSLTLGITASTGIAAINIGGATLHSWAGIGIGTEPAKKLTGMFIGQPKYEKVLERWRMVKTLIIDESS